MYKLLIIGMVISLCVLKFSEQSSAFLGNKINADNIILDNEFSNLPVMKILQDKDGFMWFITKYEISRYDGNEIKKFNTSLDREDMTEINSVDSDEQGNMWIGTNLGLLKFDINKEEFEQIDGVFGTEDSKISALCVDKSNNVYIYDKDGLGEYKSESKEFNRIDIDKGIIGKIDVDYMQAGNNEKIYLASNDGVFYYDKTENKVSSFNNYPNRPYGKVSCIFNEENELWFGTNNGIYKFDKKGEKFSSYKNIYGNPNSLNNDTVMSICNDLNGNIIIGTFGGGINILDKEKADIRAYTSDFNDPYSLTNNDIWSVFCDRDGNLWAGSIGEVNKILRNKNIFNHFKSKADSINALTSNKITAIFQDFEENVYIGTNKGLNIIDKKTGIIKKYRNDKDDVSSISSDYITSIVQDGNGDIWAGTKNDGLNKYIESKESFQRYYADDTGNSLSSNSVTSLILGKDKKIYIGTYYGLNVLEPNDGKFTNYTKKGSGADSLSGLSIKTIYEDVAGGIWIGTDNGVNRYNRKNKEFEHFKPDPSQENSISEGAIMSVFQDNNKAVWIGSSMGILNKLNLSEKTFKHFTNEDGIKGDTIYGVLGHNENLYISTNRGLFHMNTKSEQIKKYSIKNGLQMNVFNEGAFFKSLDNEIYYGGDNGFNSFYSDKVNSYKKENRIGITKIEISGLEVNKAKEVDISYKDKSFSIEFSNLNYDDIKSRYAYKLEGYDNKWIEGHKRNYVNYTNITGGKYIFKVKEIGLENGVEVIESLKVNISKNPFKTWWAFLIYSLILGGAIAIYLRIQISAKEKEIKSQKDLVEKLRKVDKMKDDFLANTSHELRTPLNGIIGLTEFLIEMSIIEKAFETTKNLRLILASGKRLLGLVNDILDMAKLKNKKVELKVQQVNIVELIKQIVEILKNIAIKKDIEIKNNIDDNVYYINADKYRLEQIIYNVLGNAIKFTLKGYVEISAYAEDNGIVLKIKDTGIGIKASKKSVIFDEFVQAESDESRQFEGTGLGLSITKKNIELHGGEIWFESEENVGSTFFIKIPKISTDDVAETDASYEPTEYLKDTKLITQNSEIPMKNIKATIQEAKEMVLEPGQEFKANVSSEFEDVDFRILVVDDDPINISVLENLLSLKKNYIVTSAESGVEALKYIKAGNEFDIVLLDVMMPIISGFKVLEEIRAKFDIFELPTVMLTAKSEAKDLVTGYHLGANDYITKPFDKEVLFSRVNNLLVLKHAVDSAIKSFVSLDIEKRERLILETLREITNILSTTLEMKELIRKIMDAMKEFIDYDMFYVFILDDEKIIQIYSKSAKEKKLEILNHLTIDCKNELIKSNISKFIKPSFDDGILFNSDNVNWKDIPIMLRDEFLGAISFGLKESSSINPYIEEIIKGIINQAAFAIENSKLYERVKKLATIDGLTGLYNRRQIMQLAKQEIAACKRYKKNLSVMMLDIDFFKKFNDTYGHQIGDQILKLVSKTINNSIRTCDIAGRYGGEEFVVILPETDINGAMTIGERLRVDIESCILDTKDFGELHCTTSIGISSYDNHEKIDDLLKEADLMLYEAKDAGRNRVVINKPESLGMTE